MTASGELDPVTLEQLERLARSNPRAGREAQAKASELDRADLEAHPEVRQRWWEAWCRGK